MDIVPPAAGVLPVGPEMPGSMNFFAAKRGWSHAGGCRSRITARPVAGALPIPGVGDADLLVFGPFPPVFSRAYAGFAQPGQVEQPVIDAVLARI